MIAIIKYHDNCMGSQTSVRCGCPSDIVFQMLYRDNAINFDGIQELSDKFSASSLTEDDIINLNIESKQGYIQCLGYASDNGDKEQLIQTILSLSEGKRKIFPHIEAQIQKLIVAIRKNDYNYIDSVHHII